MPDALREKLHLTGTKKGCDRGQGGACTVLADGIRIKSCLTLPGRYEDKKVTTVEGLAKADQLHPIQEAFLKPDALQEVYEEKLSCLRFFRRKNLLVLCVFVVKNLICGSKVEMVFYKDTTDERT